MIGLLYPSFIADSQWYGNSQWCASHAGLCLINVANVRKIETKLYTKYMGRRTTVVEIGQNIQ